MTALRRCSAPLLAAVWWWLAGVSAVAEERDLQLHSLFSDGAVLQAERPIPVYGTGTPGATVTVTLEGAEPGTVSAEGVVDKDGNWLVRLPPWPVSRDPLILQVSSGPATLVRTNLLSGDVWLFAGQSNLVGVMRYNGREEDRSRPVPPGLRLYRVPEQGAMHVVCDARGQWRSTGTVELWPAIAFYTGEQLRILRDRPQGVIVCARGATNIASWLHPDDNEVDGALAVATARFREALRAWQPDVLERFGSLQETYENARIERRRAVRRGDEPPPDPGIPGELFGKSVPNNNYFGMLASLRHGVFSALIWYQGESDAGAAPSYAGRVQALIERVRKDTGQPDLPVVLVQLPNFDHNRGRFAEDFWPGLRDAQRRTAVGLPGVVLVPTIDIGDDDDIHPRDKLPFAERIVVAIRHGALGEDIPRPGPLPLRAEWGAEHVHIHFAESLGLASGASVRGFEISHDGKEYVRAPAQVISARVVSVSPEAPAVAVRYAWRDVTETLDLVDPAGIPAGSFAFER